MREVRVLVCRYLIDCRSGAAVTEEITSVVACLIMWLIQFPFKRPACTLTQQVSPSREPPCPEKELRPDRMNAHAQVSSSPQISPLHSSYTRQPEAARVLDYDVLRVSYLVEMAES